MRGWLPEKSTPFKGGHMHSTLVVSPMNSKQLVKILLRVSGNDPVIYKEVKSSYYNFIIIYYVKYFRRRKSEHLHRLLEFDRKETRRLIFFCFNQLKTKFVIV